MGNMQCPVDDAALLASIARDICPFPNYYSNPHFYNILSNSSFHLNNHYAAVQSSLSPKQLEDFTQGLRSTFGRGGKVSHGGVGVVALSLFVLFDTVARKVKGEYVSDQEPIPGLFLQDLRGYYPPQVYTISKFLRLVPHIANNPSRMREETQRYMKQLMTDDQAYERQLLSQKQDDIAVINNHLGRYFQAHLYIHLHRLTNATVADEIVESARKQMKEAGNTNKTDVVAALNEQTKPQGPLPALDSISFNLNCDPEAASEEFLDEIKKSDQRTQAAFKKCEPENMEASKTWLHHIATLVWLDVVNGPIFDTAEKKDELIAQREDFDLKVGALGKWPR